MPTPFPGMDPYLERRGLWEEMHTRLIVMIAYALNPQLRPRYRVAVKQRDYVALLDPETLVGKPDVLVLSGIPAASPVLEMAPASGVLPLVGELPMPEEVTERFLEIRDTTSDEVITAIELLSLSNKTSREGREQYERKRLQVLGSATNLVEIDLLRAGQPLPVRVKEGRLGDYRIVVSRTARRPRADVFAFGVRDPIPTISIPLRRDEPESSLSLNTILHESYDRAGFDLAIDYNRPAVPPLNEPDTLWVRDLIARSA